MEKGYGDNDTDLSKVPSTCCCWNMWPTGLRTLGILACAFDRLDICDYCTLHHLVAHVRIVSFTLDLGIEHIALPSPLGLTLTIFPIGLVRLPCPQSAQHRNHSGGIGTSDLVAFEGT